MEKIKTLKTYKMKGKFKIIVCLTLAIVCVGLFAVGLDFAVSLIGGSGMMVAVVGPGIDVTGTVTTEEVIAADLEENDLDRTIVKVRPSDTPLDTLLREIKNTQKVGSRTIGGYEIGTKEIIDSIALAFAGGADVADIKVANKSIYSLSDTILIPSVLGGDGKSLMLYVASMNKADSTIQVVAANPVADKIPAIPLNAEIHRLSNAMSETKAQTSAFSTLPTSRTNYTQIHMCQVEQSVLQGLQKMKVAMNFSTHKEMAIWEMKRRMEFTNLFGVKSKLKDPSKKMSKSEENPNGVISMFDSREAITKKIMGATTDNDMLVKFDEENKPGISNLINIASIMDNKDIKTIEDMFVDKNYGEFKKYVAEVTANRLIEIQDKYNGLINSKYVNEILDKGINKSRLLAKEKYELIKHKLGLYFER
jgi:hypothetical protein